MKEMFRMVDKSKVDEVKQMLEYTQKGTAKATVGNYMVVLRNDPLVRESMKYNKLTGRIDIVKKLWWNEEVCKLDDDGRTYFYYFFERYYKLTSEKCMDKALRIEANSRAYHPICEYLEQLEWDGQERIRYVLQRYMGADASDFVYEVVKHFLMEALSRIYRPGCKANPEILSYQAIPQQFKDEFLNGTFYKSFRFYDQDAPISLSCSFDTETEDQFDEYTRPKIHFFLGSK